MDLFETEVAINEDALKEIKNHMMAPKQKGMLIAFIAVFACLFIFSVIIKSYVLMVTSATAVVAFIVETFLILNSYVKVNLKRIQETTNANEVIYTTSFNEAGAKLMNHSTNAVATIDYDNIARFVEAKSVYALFTKAGQFLLVNKNEIDGAQKREEFIDFLKSNCKHVKW